MEKWKSILELVCEKALRKNSRIGNRYLNWFAKKYCEKIVELEIDTWFRLRKTCRIGNAILKKFEEKYCGNWAFSELIQKTYDENLIGIKQPVYNSGLLKWRLFLLNLVHFSQEILSLIENNRFRSRNLAKRRNVKYKFCGIENAE